MINTALALQTFYGGFGLPAYCENDVPMDAVLPYITYDIVETEPLEPATHHAKVWERTTDYNNILTVVDQIKAAIGEAAVLDCDGGYVVIRPSSPYVQLLTDEDTAIKYAYISLQINCYHM